MRRTQTLCEDAVIRLKSGLYQNVFPTWLLSLGCFVSWYLFELSVLNNCENDVLFI
jgi:hypothetical protein